MSQDIYIGVDGGATNSRVRVEANDGRLLGQAIGGPANIRLSVDVAWQSINNTIADALRPLQLSLEDKNCRFHVGMGLAGCEDPAACAEYLRRAHPFATIHLTSDAHTACLGAHGAKDGAIIIIGTGVVGYQVQEQQTNKVGGWGFPGDDVGGGAWLGLEAVQLTFQWLDHRVEKSPLVQDIFAFFNNNLDYFGMWANHANSTEFARLAPLVINHSQQEEAAAVKLMKKAAQAINRIARTLEKIQPNKASLLPCSLSGGIAPFIEAWLAEDVLVRLVPRQADANAGAILMMRELVAKQEYSSLNAG